MTTLVDVSNRALQQAGATRFIADLYEGSPEAMACLRVIQPVLDQCTRAAEWGFCRAVETATLLKSATSGTWTSAQPEPPWAYEYAYPEECERLIRVMPQPGSLETLERPYLWVVAQDTITNVQQRVILTDCPSAILVYNTEVTEPDNWDPLFSELVVKTMADQLRTVMKLDPQDAQLLMQAREKIGGEAMAMENG